MPGFFDSVKTMFGRAAAEPEQTNAKNPPDLPFTSNPLFEEESRNSKAEANGTLKPDAPRPRTASPKGLVGLVQPETAISIVEKYENQPLNGQTQTRNIPKPGSQRRGPPSLDDLLTPDVAAFRPEKQLQEGRPLTMGIIDPEKRDRSPLRWPSRAPLRTPPGFEENRPGAAARPQSTADDRGKEVPTAGGITGDSGPRHIFKTIDLGAQLKPVTQEAGTPVLGQDAAGKRGLDDRGRVEKRGL
jgi:hypothetical protein